MDIEYIPGDLVTYNGNIVTIENNDGYYATYYDEDEFLQEINVNIIKGIPLTPEILEKNGWKKDKGDYINDSYHIILCEKYDSYSVYKGVNDNIVWLRDVRSVSDLQHLLFGLEINYEMEV